jgi:hypothetical protein
MINLKLEDIQFRYLFVQSFQWLDLQQNIDFAGHPGVGKVYRSVWNRIDQKHSLVIEKTLLIVDELVCTGETSPYKSNIIELDSKNIVDVLPGEEELKKLNSWIESDNKDFKKLIEQQPVELVKQPVFPDSEIVDEGFEILHHLFHINSIHYALIVDLMEELIQVNVTESDESGNPSNLTRSLESGSNGLGYNVGKVLEHIQRYSGKDRRTNEDPADLLQAMVSLVREKERRILLDLE